MKFRIKLTQEKWQSQLLKVHIRNIGIGLELGGGGIS